MSLIPKPPKPKELIPSDTYPAVCYSVVDLGHQFDQQNDKMSHKVYITWEIPDLRIDVERDGKKVSMPRVIGKKVTFSYNEKATLYAILSSWLGTPPPIGYNLHELAGMACGLTVIHWNPPGTTDMVALVSGASKLMKGVPVPTAENPLITYAIDDHDSFPENLPDWQKDIIKDSREYKCAEGKALKKANTKVLDEKVGDADDIPF